MFIETRDDCTLGDFSCGRNDNNAIFKTMRRKFGKLYFVRTDVKQ